MASPKHLRSSFGPHLRIVAAIATAVVILVLALGLGLGLGLRRHAGNASQVSPSTQSLPFLTPQTSNNFVVGSIVGQSPQDRKYDFTLSLANGAPDGVNKSMLVVNGMYPGPTIEVNQGDRLIVKVKNNFPNATSIHWHGLFQNGTNWYDGTAGITECGIPPGQSLTYNFTFGEFSGTTWYHARKISCNSWHVTPLKFRVRLSLQHHPDSTQYTDGVSGALIVHPTQNASGLPTYDGEIVIQMADLYHDQSQVLLANYLSPEGIHGQQGIEPVPDGGTVNGLGQYSAAGTGGSYFDYTIERNKTYRIRLINSGSFPAIRFSVDSHPLTLIEADGTLLAPTQVSGVIVTVAQRYSVLLHANQTSVQNGTFWIRATLQTDMFLFQQQGQNPDIRGVIRYSDGAKSGVPGDPASPDPGPGISGLIDVNGTSALTPLEPSPAPNATRAAYVTVSFQSTADSRFLGFMNTTSFEPLNGISTLLAVHQNPTGFVPEGVGIGRGDQLLVTADSIQVLDLRVDNLDDGDHPFHLHGHRPWIMGSGAGRYNGQELNATSPLRRDTVLIPAYSWMVLRFVTDNPGVWAFHCHIVWHMAAGLLMQINSQPSSLSKLTVPEDIVTYCQRR